MNLKCLIFGHKWINELLGEVKTACIKEDCLFATAETSVICYCTHCKSILVRDDIFKEIKTIYSLKEYYENLKSQNDALLLYYGENKSEKEFVIEEINKIEKEKEFCEKLMRAKKFGKLESETKEVGWKINGL